VVQLLAEGFGRLFVVIAFEKGAQLSLREVGEVKEDKPTNVRGIDQMLEERGERDIKRAER
jgi:hypothetical protein